MATLAASSSISSVLFSSSKFSSPSIFPLQRLSPSSSSLSSTFSISSSSLTAHLRRSNASTRTVSGIRFSVRASAGEKKVLIVNTNSGGHAVIGFAFAKQLLSSGHEVTIMTVGEEASDKMKKPPFNRFSDVFKVDSGHAAVEKYISEVFSNWAAFRPQYMIGSGNNKDCEEWFFDRIVRDRPVPIPGSGMQLTNIAHVRDLSSMLSLAVENPDAASGHIFNCVSDRAITLDGMAKLCAKAAGKPVEIVHYDPKAVGIDAKKAFPFRNMHFYAEPRAAKEILGWQGTTNLPEDLKVRFDEYVKIGRDKKEIKFELDDKILESLKVPVAA